MKKLLTLAFGLIMVFALVGCSNSNSSSAENTLTSEDLARIINECGGENTEYVPATTFTDEEGVGSIFCQFSGLDVADIEVGALSHSPMNITAYSIIVIKPVEGKVDVVKAALEGHTETQIQNFDKYLADQYEIACSTVMDMAGDYIVYVMAEDSMSIFNAISEKLA